MATKTVNEGDASTPWFLKSTCPVDFPSHEALFKTWEEFDAFIRQELKCLREGDKAVTDIADTEDSFTVLDTASETAEIREATQKMDLDKSEPQKGEECRIQGPSQHPFMEGLLSHNNQPRPAAPSLKNKMLTANGDLTNVSTENDLLDLFTELEDSTPAPRLQKLLEASWRYDATATLKVIFNARSIHLGKATRHPFYRCAGWLAQKHPLTLVANLKWLSRPVIAKKEKKDSAEDDIVVIDELKDENDPARCDVTHGVAHGYWKDLLNILALAANNKLDCLSDPRDILNVENPDIKRKGAPRKTAKPQMNSPSVSPARDLGAIITPRPAAEPPKKKSLTCASKFDVLHDLPDDSSSEDMDTESETETVEAVEVEVEVEPASQTVDHTDMPQVAKDSVESEPKKAKTKHTFKPGAPWEIQKRELRCDRHEAAIRAFSEDHVYRALHLTVARLFAEQLKSDLAALRGDDSKAKRRISLCAKWAPSHDRFHDRHTFVVSSIAEIMHPRESLDDVLIATDARETYLRHARERYRRDISALRKHLEVVERDITEKAFARIKYDRVPSIAMNNYSALFAEKDFERFEKYLTQVAEGKSNISGATLLPSTLVSSARASGFAHLTEEQKRRMSPKELVRHKMQRMQAMVVDGQWKTLVQRIKDSGTLSSAIAICDVSGSMMSPTFRDGTTPLDSAVGLSLLIASVTAPPFGRSFITFSGQPEVETIHATTFTEQIAELCQANWGMDTNFVAVFEKLILPMALRQKLKPEDMVKRVFVFSDMQFNSAEPRGHYHYGRGNSPSPDYDRWSTSYERIKARFEDAGYEMPELIFWNLAGGNYGDAQAKPVTANDEGTSLVSGYSQGMMKVFLESGGFDDPAEEEDEDEAVVVEQNEEGEVISTDPPAKKTKMDPLKTVKKAIGHKAYDMLLVLD